MMYVVMVVFAIGFYAVFEIDVSVRKYGYSLEAEEQLPYKMSQMYIASFKITKTFLRTFMYLTVYAIPSSLVIYYVWKLGVLDTGAIMGNNGKPFDLFAYGILAVSAVTL